ncbi:MAG: F0F1 ATP synthase subunit A [Pseudoclavibacter sp.]
MPCSRQEITLFASALNLPVFTAAAHGDDGTFSPPSLDHEFNLPLILHTLFGIPDGQPYDLNRIILVRLIAILALVILFWLAFRKPKLVPGKMQSLGELGIGFVKSNIVDGILGERLGKKYLPLLAALFFGILFMNITGIIPVLNIAGTSTIAMPIVLALVSYVAFIYAGFREAGAGTFFRNALFPPGVPWPMYILLTPIELINIFIVRPVSLALRLFLNMMVGHLLLVLCFGATHFFVFTLGGAETLFGIPTLLGGFVMTLVELLAAALQAFVFTLLTSVYIQQAAAKSH